MKFLNTFFQLYNTIMSTYCVDLKTLEQVMNIELLRDKSWRDVSEIWLAYHRIRDETLSAVIPLNQFEKFYNQSIKYPMVLKFFIT